MAKKTTKSKKKLTQTQKLAAKSRKNKTKAKSVPGSGLLKKAIQGIRKRKKLLDSI